jgi:hypothetical protein
MNKEFFQGLKSPSTRNNIISLYIAPDWDTPQSKDGSHTQDNQQIIAEVQKYYTHLFQAKPSINSDPLLNALNEGASIPDNLKSDLEAPITLKEINRAIDALATGKSPGPEGLPAEFYKIFKNFLAPYILNMIKEATTIHKLHPSSIQGDISLLFKKGDHREIRNYRPITLLQLDVACAVFYLRCFLLVYSWRLRRLKHSIT